MVLTDKLNGYLWLTGLGVILYLGASGMECLDDKIPYIETLKNPFTIYKGSFLALLFKGLQETASYDNPNKK